MTFETLRRDPDVVAAELDGEPRLLHLRHWTYIILNPVGKHIWALLDSGIDEPALVRSLLDEYDGDEAEVRTDVSTFLAELEEKGFLVRERPAP